MTPTRRTRSSGALLALELVVALLLAAVVAFLLTLATGRPVSADASMEPTLATGTRVWTRSVESPTRGEVVVIIPDASWVGVRPDAGGPLRRLARSLRLSSPPAQTRMLTRIIGVPGDEVRCCGPDGRGRLLVNGVAVPATPAGPTPFRVVVPEGHFFVATDARSSANSQCYLSGLGERSLVPRERIVARATAAGWPWQSASLTTSQAPYTGIAPGNRAPRAAIIEAAKDPSC